MKPPNPVPGTSAEPADSGDARDPVKLMPWLPCTLTLDVTSPNFTVGDLLRLRVGSIVETRWPYVSDVPMSVNGKRVGWAKFEVIGDRLAARITELL
jgi:flagellar motor switch/type III secretory pathway protein FliN